MRVAAVTIANNLSIYVYTYVYTHTRTHIYIYIISQEALAVFQGRSLSLLLMISSLAVRCERELIITTILNACVHVYTRTKNFFLPLFGYYHFMRYAVTKRESGNRNTKKRIREQTADA